MAPVFGLLSLVADPKTTRDPTENQRRETKDESQRRLHT
jgi:hypothetical protein